MRLVAKDQTQSLLLRRPIDVAVAAGSSSGGGCGSCLATSTASRLLLAAPFPSRLSCC